MDFLQKTKQTLKNAGSNISQKASDMSGTVTTSAKIREKEKSLQNAIAELGKTMYEQYPNIVEQCCPELLKTIQDLGKQLEKDRMDLAAFKGIQICPNCGAELDRSAICCSTCGMNLQEAARYMSEMTAQQSQPAPVPMQSTVTPAAAAPAVCRQCGKPLAAANAFCPHCGAKVE